jgi:hypothetical protein
MANDSSLLPTAGAPPGQASYYTAETVTTIPDAGGTVTGKGIAFDYSDHLDRIVTALEQLSLSMAFIADKVDNISDKLSNISNNSNTIATDQTTIADKQTTIADKQTIVADLAAGDGIHMKGPLDWVGLVSTYKLYVENVGPENITLAGLIAFKAKIDALPKEF